MGSKNKTANDGDKNNRPRLIWVDNGHAFERYALEGMITITGLRLSPRNQGDNMIDEVSCEIDNTALSSPLNLKALYTELIKCIGQWNARVNSEAKDHDASTET